MKQWTLVALALAAVVVAGMSVLTGCGTSSPSSTDEVPVAALTLEPATGTIISDILCDASGSSIPSRGLECRWDWESDGTWDTDWSSTMQIEHRFTGGDTSIVRVEVANGAETDTTNAQFVLDNRHGHVTLDHSAPTDGCRTLGFDGTYIWQADWNTTLIYKTDPVTGDIVDSFSSPSLWPCGIAWDGTSLWIADHLGGMRIFEVDPATGDTLSSFPVTYSHSPGGLAWDGEYLYEGICPGSREPGQIMKYTRDGTFIGEIDPPRGTLRVQGLEWDGENLWVAVADVDTLYAVDPSDGSVRFTTPMPGLLYSVAADDDGMLWVHTYDGEYKLTRLVP